MEEKELIQQLVSGDANAFAHLYKLYNRPIHQFVLKYIHSAPLAEDLTQEIFIKLWENRKNLPEIHSFKSYLFTIARNHTLNTMRSAFRSQAGLGLIITSYTEARNTTEQRNPVEESLVNEEYQAFLKRILSSLPPRTREIFTLCREQGKTYEEVAAELGISRNAVKNHMVASLKILTIAVKKELGLPLGIFLTLIHHN